MSLVRSAYQILLLFKFCSIEKRVSFQKDAEVA